MAVSDNMDITSANARAILIVDKLFPAGIVLQQFSTDQSVSMDEMTIVEDRMGVDGKLVAGYTPGIYPITIILEASSPSAAALSQVWQAMKTAKKIYKCTLIVSVPSIGKNYTWSTGVMKSGTPFPSLKKVLDPTTWKFDFQDLNISTGAKQ